MYGPRPSDRFRRGFRERDVAGLAFLHELRHRADRILDRHIAVDPRHAQDVEVVGAKPGQALLAGLAQIDLRAAAPVDVVTGLETRRAGLGMDDDLVALALEGLADQRLVMAFAVAVGRVEEVDPAIERAMDGADAFLIILHPVATRHAH